MSTDRLGHPRSCYGSEGCGFAPPERARSQSPRPAWNGYTCRSGGATLGVRASNALLDGHSASHDLLVDNSNRQGPLAFCVVAKVADWTAHGEGGLELQRGLRHFAPGAKVWVLPVQWGDGGAQVVVLGYHRGTRGKGYVRIVVSRHHLAGFRVRGVYSDALMAAMTEPWKGRDYGPVCWASREEAEQQAAYWRDHPVEAHADNWWSLPAVSDPPPLDLEHQGQTYHLAQLNAYRALYSTDEPPHEA